MADFVTGVVRFLVRAVVLAMGLVFVASLMLVVVALALLWGLRMLWAKITGQPMSPWVMRVDPAAGWNRASRAASRWQPAAKPEPGRSDLGRNLADVTDVQAKEL